MNHNNNQNGGSRGKFILKLTACLCIVGGIFYLKYASNEPKGWKSALDNDVENIEIAVPDTSVTPGVLPVTSDSIEPSVLPDTVLGKDKRRPYEAGYEDGYATGCDDGFNNQKKATYDESNSFHTLKEQKEYVRGYQEGYEEGFNDGRDGKQFKI